MRSALGLLLTRLAGGLAVIAAAFVVTTLAGHYWWPQPPRSANLIHVVEATYGQNCQGFVPPAGQINQVKRGNATVVASRSCNNTNVFCPIYIDKFRIGDPAVGCNKDFTVSWRCGADQAVHDIHVAGEAFQKVAWLSCSAPE